MRIGDFFKGMGAGVLTGMAAGIAITADRKKLGTKAERLVKAVGQAAGGFIIALNL